MRMIAAAAGGAMLLAGAAFLLGRLSGRRKRFAGAIAKTASWQAVMPPDLAAPEEPAPLAAKTPGKRVRRGHSLDHSDEPAEQPHLATAAKRVVQL
jgi:hypothetical protein